MKRLLLLVPLAACGGDDPAPCDRTVAGNICTVVGTGNSGYAGDDGDALDATMSLPQDLLAMPDGELLVLDWNNHRIRRVDGDGQIHHVAGRGELFGPDDDPNESDLNHPTALVLDPAGERVIIAAWHNSKVRQVALGSDEVTDLGGDGRRAYFGDDTAALTASFDLPASLAYDPDDNLVVMDQANQVLRAIDPDGMVHRYAGRCVIEPAGACETPVACPAPSGKTTCGDPATTCGLPCTPGYGGDDGPAMEMRMAQPFGQSADPAGRIVFDPDGNLYFADTTNALIRMIDTDGVVHRVAGTPPEAGVPQVGHDGDGGPALDATLYNPVDLALGDDGTLYVTDVYNHCVRAIDPGGDISTVAGVCGEDGFDGDGGPADAALLKRPYGIELADGVLYIADTGNNVIRAVLLP